jgi:hypothetical protein
MRIPNDSLDDFTVKPGTRKRPDPPIFKELSLTGEVEVLKPLAVYEGVVKGTSGHWFSWFHRSLAVGGAFAAAVLVFVSGVYIGLFGLPVELPENSNSAVGPVEVEADQPANDVAALLNEPDDSDLFSEEASPLASNEPGPSRSVVRHRRFRPHTLFAAYRARRLAHRPQLAVSDFAPTTLIIYAENGEIKQRIEPWLTAGYRKPPTLPD